jgi:hypothetical protein
VLRIQHTKPTFKI